MSKEAIKGLEPELIWERFYDITRVPRPSKKEEKILKAMKEFFEERNIEYKQDKVGNLVAKVPATKGYESAPIVVLQGHVDMVCEKNKGTEHDFDNDPIEMVRQDGWIAAKGTTLGSDNGIGVAAALAVIDDDSVTHGPLEILLTVDEETGLTGANNLEPGFIDGKILLNMDSEEDGAFYVGCSGGIDTVATFDFEYEDKPDGAETYELVVTGLKGGHSGLDIEKGRGNAIKILARTLNELDINDYSISKIFGGSKRNAIPREAEAILFVKSDKVEDVKNKIKEFEPKVLNEFKTSDGGLEIEFKKTDSSDSKVFTKDFTGKIIDVLLALPHGVIAMSQDIEDLVETSTNLATINEEEGKLRIGTSQRSSVDSAINYIAQSVASIFKLAGGESQKGDSYPGWKPDLDSEILNLSKKVFKETFGNEPELKAIHAGLECGILEGKNPGLDMVSFGPTIENAHSPDEKVNIETVERFYKLLKGILKKVAEEKK